MSSSVQSLSNPTKTSNAHTISLDDLSNHFSVPLADAATNLGVCVTVLKRICRENGLDRWPYRQILAGESVEDIKKHAVRERSKHLAELANPNRQRAPENKSSENTKLRSTMVPQQESSKDIQSGRLQMMLTQGSAKGMAALDEFKNGFPSDGLSITTYKWWGSNNADERGNTNPADGGQMDKNGNHQSKDNAASEQDPENEKIVSNLVSQDIISLRNARQRAAEEGRNALKLGAHRRYAINKLSKREKLLLLQIFGSSLPRE